MSQELPSSLPVSRFMSREVIVIPAEATVGEAEAILSEHGVSGAPVVDRQGQLLGVVSQSDLVREEATPRTSAQARAFFTDVADYRDLEELPVRHGTVPVRKIMTCKVVTIAPEADILTAARTMRERRIHRLLVTQDDTLVGVVSALDLLRALEEPE